MYWIEDGDLLRAIVFQDGEIIFSEPVDVLAFFIRYHHWDQHQLGLGLESRHLSGLRLRCRRALARSQPKRCCQKKEKFAYATHRLRHLHRIMRVYRRRVNC